MKFRKDNILQSLILLLIATNLGFHCKKDVSVLAPPTPNGIDMEYYLSKPDKTAQFAQQENGIVNAANNTAPTIEIDLSKTYQSIDGFGYTLTGGSAALINQMPSALRAALLNELFATTGTNIGVSYLRISIGASDLDAKVFSYNDLAAGETDETQSKFSLDPDRTNLIPVLKQILQINPTLKILGSPWSPPTWMKTNLASKGGSLKTEYYASYAQYFVKYIQQMKAEGIPIDAITIQNEPLHPGNNPSLLMPANEQAAFVKSALGPAFQAAGITTKIIIYDHNADRTDYPISILNDADAKKYIDGSAFHLYGGSISDLAQVHTAHPDKNLYFTEQWIGAPGDFAGDLRWHTREIVIGATRNWCKTVLEWNLASDPQLGPHTDGGCTQCLGAITIDGSTVVRNPAYYIIAHASKFVRPGSVRVESTVPSGLPNVAFRTPDNKTVLIVLNDSDNDRGFNVKTGDTTYFLNLPAGAVATLCK